MQLDIQTTVSNSFLKATQRCYWHFIVKNYHEKGFYENRNAIDKKINEIAQKLGENSFERKETSGLTPLHVAVLTGNREAVRFLLGKKVSLSSKDDFNCTPIDYAIKYHPEVLDLFPALAPVETELNSIFEKWHVPLDPSPCEYKQYSQDFGIEIQEMFVSGTYGRFNQFVAKEGKLALDVVFDHMVEVLEQLGVAVKRTYYPIAVRDHYIRSADGEVQKLSCLENIKKSLDRAHSLGFYFNEVGYTLNPHPFLKGFTGATVDLVQRTQDVFTKSSEMSGYIEGGNAFVLTNLNGDPQLLVGKEHFYTTLNCSPIMKSDNFSNLSNEKVYKVAEKMYAQGLLKINGSICLMGEEKIIDFFTTDYSLSYTSSKPEGESGHTLLTMAIKKGLFKRFSLQESQIEQCRTSVANYLLRKKETKSYIAEGLNINLENIQSLPQVMYHLDVFIKPGPKHSVFVQDFTMNIAIIKMLLENAKLLNLSIKDQDLLTRMRLVSEKMHQDLGPLLQEVSKKIKKAHLLPVPMPGVFFDIPETKNVFNFNFMNAVSGWSKKTGRYYYITTGVKAGDHLGDLMMQMLMKYLKSYESNLDVFFVGAPKEDRTDFTNAMRLWNDGEVMSGPHCYTFEAKTASHTG